MEKEDPASGRLHWRFLASLPAVLHHEGKEYPCDAYNLSRRGVLIVGDLPEPIRPEMDVTVRTPSGDLEIRIVTKLAHTQPSAGEKEIAYGLQFPELDEEQKKTVESLVNRVVEGMTPAALVTLPDKASVEEIREALKRVPLAHRIALAMRSQARERELLRHDPNPQVLESLARNPGLTLPEAIALARLPHLLPTTVDLLSRDPRWAGNDEMNVLLATHPRGTFSTADRLVSRMSPVVLQRVLQRPGLHPGVREKLMRKLSRSSYRA